MLSVAGATVESAGVVRCVRRYGACLESALAYCVVDYCGPVALHAWRQPRSPSCSSKRQLAQAKPGCQAFAKAKATGRVDVYTQG